MFRLFCRMSSRPSMRTGSNSLVTRTTRWFSAAVGARLPQTVCNALNKQAQRELFASHQYLSASLWFKKRNLDGCASFLFKESADERKHAESILNHIATRDEESIIPQIGATNTHGEWKDPVTIFSTFLALEEQFTIELSNIVLLAREQKDVATEVFIAPFLKNQIDSVDKMRGFVEQLRAYKMLPGLIYHFDHQIRKA
eukprot:TRINITY_DN2530_c0_g1_i1.p1 TRINITY_DN2530_c0_g1~~TRINITY_DN2530_c0_g1_i1.p1  ORF type:complete len:219 (-),score=19.74 TRINITY_DN2530_c0_g1_i1:272-868(-)